MKSTNARKSTSLEGMVSNFTPISSNLSTFVQPPHNIVGDLLAMCAAPGIWPALRGVFADSLETKYQGAGGD